MYCQNPFTFSWNKDCRHRDWSHRRKHAKGFGTKGVLLNFFRSYVNFCIIQRKISLLSFGPFKFIRYYLLFGRTGNGTFICNRNNIVYDVFGRETRPSTIIVIQSLFPSVMETYGVNVFTLGMGTYYQKVITGSVLRSFYTRTSSPNTWLRPCRRIKVFKRKTFTVPFLHLYIFL